MFQRMRLVAAVALTLALAGCLIPETFDTAITIADDGAFTFKFDGTVAFALAVAEIAEKGSLPPADDREVAKLADELKKDPCTKSASYKGQGRFQWTFICSKKKNESLTVFENMFSVARRKDGGLEIGVAPIKPADKDQLKKLGMQIKGTLKVSVPSGWKVLETNATSKPFVGFGGYGWDIGSVDSSPRMIVVPPEK